MATKTFSSLPKELRNSLTDIHFFVQSPCMSVTNNVHITMFVLLGKNLFKMLKNVNLNIIYTKHLLQFLNIVKLIWVIYNN